MATIVLGAVGAAIGSSFAGFMGMSGAALGWNIGSLVGGYLFAPKQPTQYGPRLGDLKVQVSTYGNAIPIIYGSVRVAGNCIWSTPKIETAHSQTSGGKGGGGGVTQVSYTYSQSFAIAICEGEITGIRKIWANGKLIYNLSDTATVATIIASNKAAAGIRIYTGSEMQTADSLIQASVGAADTPAYRGTAYVVFENLQLLNEWGQQMPNLEFEVIKSWTTSTSVIESGNANSRMFFRLINGNYLSVYPYLILIDGNLNIIRTISGQTGLGSSINRNGNLIAIGGTFGLGIIDSSGIYRTISTGFQIGATAFWGNYIIAGAANGLGAHIGIHRQDGSYPFEIDSSPGFANRIRAIYVALNNKDLYVFGVTSELAPEIRRYELFGMDTESPSAILKSSYPASSASYSTNASFVEDSNGNIYLIYGVGNMKVTVIDPITNNYGTYIRGGGGSTSAGSHAVIIGEEIYIPIDWRFTDIRPMATFNINSHVFADFFPVTDYNNYNCFSDNEGVALTGMREGVGFTSATFRFSTPIVSNTTLATIVTDICAMAGLTAGQIDVDALTDTVDGYVVQRGTARSWLEPLMQAYYFDAVESDGKIKFVKRGGAATVAIPEADLAAHEYGTALPDNLLSTRKQEMELPVEVDVQYMDTSAAYQVGSQQSRRLTTDSENKISVNLALAMSGTKAKQISDVLMYEAWTSRMRFDFLTSWKYAHLEPTDVVTVTKGNRTYTLRIVDEDASGGIYRRQAVLEDASIYTQNAAAAPIVVAGENVSSVPLTDMVLMDIPLLRDQDDGVGFYAAACGYADGWRGAQAFKSNDGGATWTSFGPGFLNEATIGSASTVLGDFHSGNIFDELNTVTVALINGTLSSDTEINILNGANVALLGDEIIQFKNAVLTASNTYILTGLLRGRRGTEFGMATHASGERFVVLTETTTYLFTGTSDEYDLLRHYRGVSFGGFLDDAATIGFTNTAAELMPYSPVLLGGGRNAALDVVLTWTRRTRLGGAWNNYSDVPVGETTEAYEVEIWDSAYAVLKRTITGITSATTTYMAAQQTTDFGGTQATVYFKVFQVSAIVGRGFEARGTV